MTTLTSGTTGTTGDDKIVLGGGDELFDAGLGSDTLNAGAGNDTLIYTFANEAGVVDYYNGGSGKDTLVLDFSQYGGWTYEGWEAFEARVAQRVLEFKAMVDAYKAANGNLPNSGASAFTFDFGTGTQLQVAMIENVKVIAPNFAPVITSGPQAGTVQEDGILLAQGAVVATDPNPNDVLTYSGTRIGQYGTFTVSPNGTWTYTLANGTDGIASALQSLAGGQEVKETFQVTVTDDKGAAAVQSVVITIQGTNDKPEITSAAQTGAVQEDGTLEATGMVKATDIDQGGTRVFSGNAEGVYGHFTVTDDGQWTYTLNNGSEDVQALAGGERDTEIFTVTVTDDKGATATQAVTIDVAGTNDAPALFFEEFSDIFGADLTVQRIGTFEVIDPDHGAALSFSGDATSAYGSFLVGADGHWVYSQANNEAFRELAEGDFVTEHFTLTVTDDKGAILNIPETIIIGGVNDAPVITSTPQSGTVTEDGQLTASGRVTATDVDHGAVLTYSGDAIGTFGTFTVEADGRWTYTLHNDAALVQSMGEGDFWSETFNVTVTDDQGANAAEDPGGTVIITIRGTNDAPEVSGAVAGTAIANGAASTLDALAHASDADDNTLLQVVAPATLPAGVTYDETTHSFTLDPTNPAYQSVLAGQGVPVSVNYMVTDGLAITPASAEWTVAGVNHAPTALKFTAANWTSDTTLPGAGVTIGTMSAVDVDGDPLTWSVQGDPNFSINGLGQLSSSVGLAPSSVYSLTLSVSDSPDPGGAVSSQQLIISTGTSGVDTTRFALSTESAHYLIYALGSGTVSSSEVIFTGSGDDIVFGQGGRDGIFAGAGDDVLYGGGGDDSLFSDPGNDILVGGPGNDFFVFDDFVPLADMGGDRIEDFYVGRDKIALGDQTFAGLPPVSNNTISFNPSQFASVTSMADLVGDGVRIVAHVRTDGWVDVLYDSNGGTLDNAIHFLTVGFDPASSTVLSSTDFLVS